MGYGFYHTLPSQSLPKAANAVKEEIAPLDAAAQAEADEYLKKRTSLLPSDVNPSVTKGFEERAKIYPWLNIAKKSVCQMGYVKDGKNIPLGTAVRVDWGETFSFCSHQLWDTTIDRKNLYLNFYPRLGNQYNIPISLAADSEELDLALAVTIPHYSDYLNKAGHWPVEWARQGISSGVQGREIVTAGYAEGQDWLHAESGPYRNHLGFMNAISTTREKVITRCKSQIGARGHLGMSGGPAFNTSGSFEGVFACISLPGEESLSYYTPVSALQKIYEEIYPQRALEAGLMLRQNAAPIPLGCSYNRRALLVIAR